MQCSNRFLCVADLVEVFSASQGKEWNCGATNGEGLSRVLATALFPTQITGFASAPDWLAIERPTWSIRTSRPTATRSQMVAPCSF
jgi:hypothetical protein